MPVHITFASRVESASAVIAPIGLGLTVAPYFPALAGGSHEARVRSPLNRVHVAPLSVDFHTAFEA